MPKLVAALRARDQEPDSSAETASKRSHERGYGTFTRRRSWLLEPPMRSRFPNMVAESRTE
jgi:hypothetical protein